MTGSTLPRLPFTLALQAMLEEVIGFPVGLRRIPTKPADDEPNTQVPVKRPYAILYPLWRRTFGPPFGAPDADAEWTYQVSLYAERADQLDGLVDRTNGAVLDREDGAFIHAVTVPGVHCYDRVSKEDNGGDLQLDEEPSQDLRFGFLVTPRTP